MQNIVVTYPGIDLIIRWSNGRWEEDISWRPRPLYFLGLSDCSIFIVLALLAIMYVD